MAGEFRRRDVVAIVVTIALTAVVCVGVGLAARDTTTSPADSSQPGAAPLDPRQAVGAWWINGEPTLEGRLVALLPNGELTIYGDDDCEMYGSWTLIDSGLANFGVDSWLTRCTELAQEASLASDTVAGMRLMDKGVELTTISGDVVATLQPADDPSSWPQSAQNDEDLLAGLQEPFQAPRGGSPTLPEGMSALSLEELTSHRWLPLISASSSHDWPDQPFAEFHESGGWTGSDGCNGQGGRWALDVASGEWMASSGISTLIGCDNVEVSGMVTSARLAALNGDELVFFDDKGTETGRFVPDE